MPHDLIQDDYLREQFAEGSPVYAYINRMRTRFNLGADIVGVIMVRTQAFFDLFGMSELADRMVYAPGDRVLNFGSDANAVYATADQASSDAHFVKRGLGMPIAYDIWYVFPAGNMLEFGGKGIEDSMAKMADFFSAVDNASPLKLCDAPPAPGPYTIKEARFETWIKGNSENYVSAGPKSREASYAGYVAFPIGPLGVMWKLSLATQSALAEDGASANVHPVGGTNGVVSGGELLPPFDIEHSEIFGEELMDRGWIVSDESSVEIFAEDFGGADNPTSHYWLRYWIKEDNTNIVPGEFVAMMCRPWPLHAWWYQETAPFVYAGTWVETEFYTSGIVKEVIPPEEGEVGNRYRVWVKNEEIIVKSSDFLEYEEDEQVGLLKTYRESAEATYDMSMGPADNSSGQGTNFNWQHLALQNTGGALNTEWVIVPVDFFGTSGSSVGGA